MKFFNYLKKTALMSTLFAASLITTGCNKTTVEEGQIKGNYDEFEQETFNKELAEFKFTNIAGEKEQTELGLKIGTGINIGLKYKEKEVKLDLEGEAKARMYDENEKMHLQAVLDAKTNLFMDKGFLAELGNPITFENNIDLKSEDKIYLVDDILYTNIATDGVDALDSLLNTIDQDGTIKGMLNSKQKTTIDPIKDILEEQTVKGLLTALYSEIEKSGIEEQKASLTFEAVKAELTKYGLTLGFDTKKGLKLKLATTDAQGEALLQAIVGEAKKEVKRKVSITDTLELEELGLEFYVALDEDYMFQAAALKVNTKGALAIGTELLEFNGSAFLNVEYGKQEIKLPSFEGYTELGNGNPIISLF